MKTFIFYQKQRVLIFFSTVSGPITLRYAFDDQEYPNKKEIEKLRLEGYSKGISAIHWEIVTEKISIGSRQHWIVQGGKIWT